MAHQGQNVPLRGRLNSTSVYSLIGVIGLAITFLFAFVVPLRYRVATFHPWQTGDWLIDYSAGFVRRGLFGAILGTYDLDAIQLIASVALIQFILAGALYGAVAFLFWRTSGSPAWIMLVLSPAFMLFPLLNPDASARKELLGLVALAIVAVATSLSRTSLGALIAIPFFALAAFSHEVNIVMLPAFLYLIIMHGGEIRRQLRYVLPVMYGLIGLVAGASALIESGDTQTVADICANWLSRGIPDCSGALLHLNQTPQEAQRFLLAELFPTYWGYLIPAALALVPLFAVRFLPKHWIIALIIFATSAPLFFIAWDYGRWIFIITAQLSLIALAIDRRGGTTPVRVPLYAALAFILLWGVEHIGEPITPGLLVRIFT
jgi:hypothetical protein